MSKQLDVYIDGAYIGRASHSLCKALCAREMERRHWVHGVVNEDTDPPRLMFNPTRDESPALVRRVVEAINGKMEPDIKDAARAFEQAINSDPDLRVEAHRIETCPLGDEGSRCVTRIFVTRTSSEQVYP